jgi:hypothetical protein
MCRVAIVNLTLYSTLCLHRHPPMAVQWEFTLVKAYDEDFAYCFPKILVGCIFKNLKTTYYDREFIHLIRKRDSLSFSMHGLSSGCITTWGDLFPPNHASPSTMYRECPDDHGAWIDTKSQILCYKYNENRSCEYVYEGMGNIFAGSNPIPQTVQCSEERFFDFAMSIRNNYIRIVCDSSTVCLVENGHIQSTHKVCVSPQFDTYA